MKVAAVIAAVAILALGLWGAAELHYRSCVTAAAARTPVTVVTSNGGFSAAAGGAVPKVTEGRRARQRAVDGCSRLP